MKHLSIFVIFIFIIVFFSCDKRSTKPELATVSDSPDSTHADYEPYHTIVTTDYISEIIYQFARSRTRGRAVIPRGENPLFYQPTEEDRKDILEADLVLYNGLGLEPYFEDILAQAAKITKVIDLSKAVPKEKLLSSDHYSSGYDPHYFKDPDIWLSVAKYVLEQLSEIDPEAKFNYGSIYLRYGESLSLQDIRYLEPWSSRLPTNRRYLVTLHDSFAYFGKRYGYETYSLLAAGQQVIEPERITQLAHLIIQNDIPAIFYEESFSKAPLESLRKEVENLGSIVALAGPLYSYYKAPLGDRLFSYVSAGRKEMQIIFDNLKTEEMKAIPK